LVLHKNDIIEAFYFLYIFLLTFSVTNLQQKQYEILPLQKKLTIINKIFFVTNNLDKNYAKQAIL